MAIRRRNSKTDRHYNDKNKKNIKTNDHPNANQKRDLTEYFKFRPCHFSFYHAL